MAITIAAGISQGPGSSVPNVVITVPGSVSGDISVVCVYMYGSGILTLAPPAGWTSLGFAASAGSTAAGGIAFWRQWQPGDPTSFTYGPGQGGNARIVALPFRLRGASSVVNAATQAWGPVSAGNPLPAPSIAGPNADDMLLTYHGLRNGGSSGAGGPFSPPAGMTELMEDQSVVSASANVGGIVSYKTLTAAGATGVQNATCSVTGRGDGWSFIATKKTLTSTVLRMKGGASVTVRHKS